MSKLLIEQMLEEVEKTASEATETSETTTEETSVEKTAEEIGMEKIAHEINVLDQSRTLVAIGEELFKFACEVENESIKALAADTYHLGERMGVCLTKTASEDGSALEEAMEIAEDMHKIASYFADLADEVKTDETLNKMAEAVINIANELTDDANEVYAQLEKEASEETEEEAPAEEEKKNEEEVAAEEEVEKEAMDKEAASEFHKTQKSKGFETARIWKARGIGAATAGTLGAVAGGMLGGKQGALAGAAIGGLAGAADGESISRYKQVKEHAKKEGRNHPTLRALFSHQAHFRMQGDTPTKESLKQLNPGSALVGAINRKVRKAQPE